MPLISKLKQYFSSDDSDEEYERQISNRLSTEIILEKPQIFQLISPTGARLIGVKRQFSNQHDHYTLLTKTKSFGITVQIDESWKTYEIDFQILNKMYPVENAILEDKGGSLKIVCKISYKGKEVIF